jgi:hypothetical protein
VFDSTGIAFSNLAEWNHGEPEKTGLTENGSDDAVKVRHDYQWTETGQSSDERPGRL